MVPDKVRRSIACAVIMMSAMAPGNKGATQYARYEKAFFGKGLDLRDHRGGDRGGGLVVLGDVDERREAAVRRGSGPEGLQAIDVPAEDFVKEAMKVSADFVASSALLTTTRPQQKIIEQKLSEAGIRGKVKTIIGGSATDRNWGKEVGCDFYAADAAEGVKIITEACRKLKKSS